MRLGYLPAKTVDAIDTLLGEFDGALVVDEKGKIIVYTEKYAQVAKIPREQVLGRYVLDVFPTSRMMEVVNTGKPIYVDLWEVGGEVGFVSRIPITAEGRVVGAVAVCVFRYVYQAREFAEHVKNMGQELQYYKDQVRILSAAKYSFDTIVGVSQAITAVKEMAQTMVKGRAPVLILGETGTGKELFAHAIHHASTRRERPFIRVNCASIPENLIESELFGYEEGAFTGAKKGGKPGKFELAHGGTIFLDEINELPYYVQAKLLRVLQEGEIDRVGGLDLRLVDVRVISATSANLSELIKNKGFREDLFYRINAFQLRVPPLRDRPEDLPLLCAYFIEQCNLEQGTDAARVDNKVLQIFAQHPWPGNVRELRNLIQRACLNAGSGPIETRHLPPEFIARIGSADLRMQETLAAVMDLAEKDHLVRILRSVQWNRNKAAEILRINRTHLYRKMRKHHLFEDQNDDDL
ncbi:MAG: sigma-54 interaction domain-containing protein [Solirubrobacterales bacterium]